MRYVSRSTISHTSGVVVVLAVTIALHVLLDTITNGVVQMGQFPWWLPQLGTVAETVYAYSLFVAFVTYVVTPVLIFGLGYRYGKSQTAASFEE